MQQVGCCSQQGPPGDVQRLLPPGVRAQDRHDASVVLQREGDDIAIQRLLLLGGAQPDGQAVIPPELNHTRPGRGEASSPVHPPSPGYSQPAAALLQTPLGVMVYGMAADRLIISPKNMRRRKHIDSHSPGRCSASLCRCQSPGKRVSNAASWLPVTNFKINPSVSSVTCPSFWRQLQHPTRLQQNDLNE